MRLFGRRARTPFYYTAASFPGIPVNTGGVLLGVPRRGGTVRVLLPALQAGVAQPRFLTAPSLSPDGSRIAFYDLTLASPPTCDVMECSVADTLQTQPLIARGRLRIRGMADAAADVAALDIVFQGRTFDPARAQPFGLNVLDDLPFQHHFTAYRQPTFRAAWSPDGARIVFSDGVRLLLWQPGSAPVPIAGTDDGVWPAWSPDGQWIAFTHLPRGARRTTSCTCYLITNSGPSIVEVQERAIYENRLTAGTLTLVRPDGTGRRELGEGDAPAWLPDNSALIVARSQALWRIRPDGTGAAQLPNSERASGPAVSRDGRYVAFARHNQGMDWNVWVLRLDGAQ